MRAYDPIAGIGGDLISSAIVLEMWMSVRGGPRQRLAFLRDFHNAMNAWMKETCVPSRSGKMRG